MQIKRWKQRHQNFSRALGRLEAALKNIKGAEESLSEQLSEGMIQRFEYTFELGWKLLKDILQDQGFGDEVKTPRGAIEAAFKTGMIKDGVLWLEMLEARNLTTHLYDETVFKSITQKVSTQYLEPLQALDGYAKKRP